MKRIVTIAIFAFILVSGVYGQAPVLKVRGFEEYMELFKSRRFRQLDPKKVNIDEDYSDAIDDDNWYRFAALNGNLTNIDTGLEVLLVLYYSPGVVAIRPVEADTYLPINEPKLADQKLGAAVLQEIQVLRFLGDTAAVGRHEGILKFITDRGNVTRAEVEAYYRSGIRTLISEAVDEEFNKVSFLLRNISSTHTSVLTRNPQNGQYVLSYGGTYTNGEIKTITGNSVEALSREMREGRYKADFDETGINAMKAQAALIPGVVYERWRAEGRGDGMAVIKDALTDFYINPNTATYTAMMEIYRLYEVYGTALRYEVYEMAFRDNRYIVMRDTYYHVISNLNYSLAQMVSSDASKQITFTALTTTQRGKLVEMR